MSILFPLLVITVLVLLNGLFVAAEFSIVAAPRTRIAQMAEEGSKTAVTLLEIYKDPEKQNRFITTAQVGITLVSLALGMYGERVFAEWVLEILHALHIETLSQAAVHSIATVLAVGLLTYIHVVIGEMIPKSLALQNAAKTVFSVYSVMAVTNKIFAPMIWSLNHLSIWITKLLGIHSDRSQANLFTSEELEYLVDESSEVGLFNSAEQLIIQNVLDLEERTVAHAMTPRNRFISIPITLSRKDTLKIVSESSKTRYPVYEDTIDNILGVLHIKDLARDLIQNKNEADFKLKNLIRPVMFVPETLVLDELLTRFRSGAHQIAVVFGEFGGTSGLITMEDIVEEVVGEIQDEFDTDEREPIEELRAGILKIRGDVILDELNQLYHLKWEHDEAHTISGLVMSLLGKIPEVDDEVVFNDAKITVLEVEQHAVKSILLEL